MNGSVGDTMMDFERKLGHPKVWPLVEAIRRDGSARVPGVVELDPTTACNYRCPECISASLLNAGEMSRECLTGLLVELAQLGAAAVIFIGGGEPLAHSAMPEPLRLAHSLGLRVGLTTNGYFVPRHLESIAESVDWIRVSMDAAREETYRAFRPNRDPEAFSKVLQGLRDINVVKHGRVGYSFLLMSRSDGTSNFGEILHAAELARSLGCDYFELKPAVDDAHALIPWSSEERSIVEEQVSDLLSLETNDFAIVLANSLQHLLRGEVSQPKAYTHCPTVELRTVITHRYMYACPYKRGHTSAGWPFGEDFRSSWEAGARRRASINPSQECSFYCIRHDLNLRLLDAEEIALVDEVDDPFV